MGRHKRLEEKLSGGPFSDIVLQTSAPDHCFLDDGSGSGKAVSQPRVGQAQD